MTISTELRALWLALHELRDALLPLRLLVLEDHPEGVAPQPVRALGDGLDDVFGALSEGIEALSDAMVLAEDRPRQRGRLIRLLATCHDRLIDFGRHWAGEVSAYHQLAQLTVAARERGPHWQVWAATVVDGVIGCEGLRCQVHLALLACWQELAEHANLPQESPCSPAATKER